MDQCSQWHDIPSALQATSPNRPGHDLALGINIHPGPTQCSPASGSMISVLRSTAQTRQRHADRLPLVLRYGGDPIVPFGFCLALCASCDGLSTRVDGVRAIGYDSAQDLCAAFAGHNKSRKLPKGWIRTNQCPSKVAGASQTRQPAPRPNVAAEPSLSKQRPLLRTVVHRRALRMCEVHIAAHIRVDPQGAAVEYQVLAPVVVKSARPAGCRSIHSQLDWPLPPFVAAKTPPAALRPPTPPLPIPPPKPPLLPWP